MRKSFITAACLLAMAVTSGCTSLQWSAGRIDEEADRALRVFHQEIDGGETFLAKASGYLVFPRVLKAGIGIGAETGEGVLRVGGQSVDYYRTTSGSIGFQAGAQAKSIVVVFLTPSSLEHFRRSRGWKVGIDGSVALIDIGAGKAIDTDNIRAPVLGFVFDPRGLMYNLTFEGSKFTRLAR
jgi:lipid-binding SYLF domain-containing protein